MNKLTQAVRSDLVSLSKYEEELLNLTKQQSFFLNALIQIDLSQILTS